MLSAFKNVHFKIKKKAADVQNEGATGLSWESRLRSVVVCVYLRSARRSGCAEQRYGTREGCTTECLHRRQHISVRWAQDILSPIPPSQLSGPQKGSLDFAPPPLLRTDPHPENVILRSKAKQKRINNNPTVCGHYLIRVTLLWSRGRLHLRLSKG